MKLWIGIGIGLLLSSCAVAPLDRGPERMNDPSYNEMDVVDSVDVTLEDFGLAPELHNEVWLNTDEPLRLANLRGQVVLLDMWTFG